MAGLNINKMLSVSMETQTNGIYGAGTPLGFVSDPGLGKTAIVRSFCESINHHCEVIILGRVPSIDIGGMYAPNFETKELIQDEIDKLNAIVKEIDDRTEILNNWATVNIKRNFDFRDSAWSRRNTAQLKLAQ